MLILLQKIVQTIEIWKLDVGGVDQFNTTISAVPKVVPQNGQIYFVCTTTTQNGSNQTILERLEQVVV